jgi:4-hydroxyacetophenone monooxygenase
VVPSIAGTVGELTVFQRTPPWMLPTPTYHDDIPDGQRWLLRHVPNYHRWFRFLQFWLSIDGRRPFVTVDPEWEHPVSVSADNESLRRLLVAHLEGRFGDRPDLLAKVMPGYPPGAKRMMRDNGVWPAALHRENVNRVNDAITEIVPSGVRTADGSLHEVDVVVYATGFTASDFLSPTRVTGRGGVDLHEYWKGDARAYLGIHVPEFPNLFCVFGPNTGLVINGSVLLFSEIAVHHVLGCIRLLLERDQATLDVRPEVFDSYQRSIDEGNLKAAWGASTVNSWYKNGLGRVSQVWPFSVLDYWTMVREPDPADYAFTPQPSVASTAARTSAAPGR